MKSVQWRGMIALGTMAVLVTACGKDDLPDYFLLDRLRVLGANTPVSAAEFSAGDTGIQIEFHVSDPLGAGRTLTYSLEGCVDPGIGLGATPSCAGSASRTVITASASFVPGTAATNYYGVLTTPAFAVPATTVIYVDPVTGSPLPAYRQANGAGYLVLLTLTAPNGETTTAYKRIVVSTKTAKNANPVFGAPALLFDGTDASTFTLGSSPFTAVAQASTGSAESYVVQSASGSETKTEKLTVTWFVTSGSVRYSRTDPGATNSYAPVVPLATKTSFIAILRDDRGGMSITALHK